MKMRAIARELFGQVVNGVGDMPGAFVFGRADLCFAHDLNRSGAAIAELLKSWICLDRSSTAAS